MPADSKPAIAAKPGVHWNLWLFGALLVVIGVGLLAVTFTHGSAIRHWLRDLGASSSASDMLSVFPGVIAGFFGLMLLGRAVLADIVDRLFPPIVGRSIMVAVGLFWIGLVATYLIPAAWAKAKNLWASCGMDAHLASAKGWLSANGTVLIIVLLVIIAILLAVIVMRLRSRSASDKPTS